MTLKTTKLRDAISFTLVAGATALTGSGTAFAQSSAPATSGPATDLDRIEVTGSRIRRTEVETAQPIITLTRQQIEQQGFTSVADILQNLTSSGSPAIARAETLASGENVGGYYIDLRNLGANRTLVLLNGRRLGATTGGLQDLSQVPMGAIDRIEVLKDGASSVYGSDAIAGVVNIITRSNFDGMEASAYVGQFSQGDGAREVYDVTIGFTGERGSMLLTAEYSDEDPVWARDRDFSAFGNAGPDYPGSGASPVSQNGSFFGPCGPGGANTWCTLIRGQDPRALTSYRPHVTADNANSNQQMMNQTGIERRGVFGSASYDITDSITYKGSVLFNDRTTTQTVAGYPYQSGSFGTPLSGESYFNPLGEDVEFRRRLWEYPRTTTSNLKTSRFVQALEGYFSIGEREWDWDVGAVYNQNDALVLNRGDASLPASEAALGPSFFNPATGRVECGSLAGLTDPDNPNPVYGSNIGSGQCVPWNPLLPYGEAGAGSLDDPTLRAFMFPEYHTTGETTMEVYSANMSGSLFTLPAGDLGMAVGVEHRREEGRFVPDAFNQAGLNTGLPATTTEGAYSVDEAYVEFEIPLLSDIPFAQELTLNVASRYSDFSNFGETTNNKFSVRWRPIDDLLIRATHADGFRAPAIDNLYGGLGGSFEFYTDPCSVGVTGSVAGNAACTAAGVPANYAQLGQGLVPCTGWPCQTPDQFLSGSNPNLGPERAKSKTAGLVYSPSGVENLDVTVDWFSVRVENTISADSVENILRDCYVLGNSARCAGIVRAPDGHISNMFFGLTNLGWTETEGWDLGLTYRMPDTAYGQFGVNWQSTYTSKYDQSGFNAAGDEIVVGFVGTPGVFRVRSNMNLDWKMGDFGVSYTARYYSGMREACVTNRPCTDPDRYANGETAPVRRTGANTFHDVQAYVELPWNARASIGANNVTEHMGSIQFTAPNSQFPYYGGFDIGRFIYMRYTQRF